MLLASIDVRVFADAEVSLPHPNAYLLYSLVLDLIHESNPALAETVHAPAKYKPVTVSTLYGCGKRSGETIHIPKLKEARFRISTIGKDLYEAVSTPLFQRLTSKGYLRIGNTDFHVLDVFVEPDEDGRRGSRGIVTNFPELLQIGATSATVKLRFHSPTSFRQRGRNLPVPLPKQVFDGLQRRWEHFSPIALPCSITEEVYDDLVVSQLSLRSRIWKTPKTTSIGSVGYCTYTLLGNHGPEICRSLHTLAAFAFFAGIGHRTTMGMGQCSTPSLRLQ